MDEITLRLPTATTAVLESEADERGVSLDEHLRDIIDAYRADDEAQPGRAVEYVHAVGQTGTEREGTTGRTEEIASFRYGSRSILSE